MVRVIKAPVSIYSQSLHSAAPTIYNGQKRLSRLPFLLHVRRDSPWSFPHGEEQLMLTQKANANPFLTGAAYAACKGATG